MSSSRSRDHQLVVRRALVSVWDKQGIVEFATALVNLGVEVLSTGGTAKLLEENGVAVTQVSNFTGQAEMMDGRVKTLHPKIHGGILARYDSDQAEMATHRIDPIDLVVVSLYPFESVSADTSKSRSEIIENIDIGGPTMIRAAAKNYAWTGVIVEQADYQSVLDEIQQHGGISEEKRFELAAKAFRRTFQYESSISAYFSGLANEGDRYPQHMNLSVVKREDMRYGENPHQQAAFYIPATGTTGLLANASLLQGKPLSFNNLVDVEAGLNCVLEFEASTCVIIKHATPCGVAQSEYILRSYDLAYQTDPISAFGGVIALNRSLDKATAHSILERQFVEAIIAPSVESEAMEILQTRKNIRVLQFGESGSEQSGQMVLKSVGGGLLVQDADELLMNSETPEVVTQRNPNYNERNDLLFAWRVAKHVKSNAIVYAKNGQTVGIGAGQMSRVDSASIAVVKANSVGMEVSGAVMASDAFFPFRDGIDKAAEAGVRAVIQPGGSMRDSEVIEAANEHDMAMLFTGMRHFRH